MPNLAKSQDDILREALREILDRTNREKTRDYYAALKGGIIEIHDIANTALAEFDLPPKSAPVNAAAMREALNQLRDWALLDINENAIRSDEPNYKKLVDGIVEITNAALAAPARNCDVGTADEQTKRFLCVCRDTQHFDDVRECPLFVGTNCNPLDCLARWAQMPFAPAEGWKE